MKTETLIEGSGGGGKGGGNTRQPVESPNTLQSRGTARILDLISWGPCRGLVDTTNINKSVYYDGTPATSQDDTVNYEGVVVHERKGDPDQAHITGFPAAETTVSVNTEVTFDTPITRRITDSEVDAVRAIISIPALTELDTETGDQNGSEVTIQWYVKSAADQVGSQFIRKVTDRIVGKHVAAYERAYRIELSGDPPWDIRMERVTADSDSQTLSNQTFWASYVELVDRKMTYPNRFVVGTECNAELFGDAIPQRAFNAYGLISPVPSNYDPENHSYSGEWDGTFKNAWHRNPAWVVWSMLTNNLFGLGDILSEADIDKWTLYQLGQYCDEDVPDGNGGYEPRFTFTHQIMTQTQALQALEAVMGMMRGSLIWTGGEISFTQDKIKSASRLFTPANVKDGKFNYSGSALSARHTVAYVEWINPDRGDRPDILVIEDADAINRYGYRPLNVAAMGATTRGQAYRHGLNILLTEKLETEAVQFVVGQDSARMSPGEIIKIADPSFTVQEYGGKIKSATGSQFVLDREFEFEAGKTYTINWINQQGALASSQISNPLTTTDTVTLGVTQSGVGIPVVGAMWTLESNDVKQRKFRVMGIEEEDEGHEYKVIAFEYDESKFNAIDDGVLLDALPGDFSDLSNPAFVEPPTNLTMDLVSQKVGQTRSVVLVGSFSKSDHAFLRGYRIKYRVGNGNYVTLPEQKLTNFQIDNMYTGLIYVQVQAVSVSGVVSRPLTGRIDFRSPTSNGKDLISNLQIRGGGTEWTGRDIHLDWDSSTVTGQSSNNDQDLYFKRYEIDLMDNEENVLRTFRSQLSQITIPYDELHAAGLRRLYKISVSLVDSNNSRSNAVQITISNTAPALPAVTIAQTIGQTRLDYERPTDPDFEGLIVYMQETPNVQLIADNLVFKGSGVPYIDVPPDATYYVRYAAYDAFGTDGLNWSGDVTVDGDGVRLLDFDPEVTALINESKAQAQEALDTVNALAGTFPGFYTIGGFSDCTFTATVSPVGHVQVSAGFIDVPATGEVTIESQIVPSPYNIIRAPSAGYWAIIYAPGDIQDRFDETIGSDDFFAAIYEDSKWYAVGSELDTRVEFTPAATDIVMAKVIRAQDPDNPGFALKSAIEEIEIFVRETTRLDQKITLVEARLDDAEATITTTSSTLATTSQALADYQVSTNARLDTAESDITTTSTALTDLDSAFAQYQLTVSASFGNTNASVSANATAVANINGKIGSMFTLAVAAGNRIGGVIIQNDGSQVSAYWDVDAFAVGKAGATPFRVVGNDVFIKTAYIDEVNANVINAGILNVDRINNYDLDTDKLSDNAVNNPVISLVTPDNPLPNNTTSDLQDSFVYVKRDGTLDISYAVTVETVGAGSNDIQLDVVLLLNGVGVKTNYHRLAGEFTETKFGRHTFAGYGAGSVTVQLTLSVRRGGSGVNNCSCIESEIVVNELKDAR